MKKQELLQSLKRNIAWFENSGIMIPADGSWGVAERIFCVGDPELRKRVQESFGAFSEYGRYSVIEARRADCNFEAALMYLLAAKVDNSGKCRQTAENILAFLYNRSGVFSALVDLGFFSLFYYQLCREFQTGRLLAAVVLARLISLTVNYLTNKLLVFREHSKRLFNAKSFGKYLLLCAVIMFASYFLTKFVGRFFNDRALLLIKCGVDVTLFFSSF